MVPAAPAMAQNVIAHNVIAHNSFAHNSLAHNSLAHNSLAHSAFAQNIFAKEVVSEVISQEIIAQADGTRANGTQADETQAINWEDLQAQSTHLRNPYEHLSETQTYQLSTLYQLKEWAKVNTPEPESIEAKEIQRLEKIFADEGIDAEALLVHADEARAYWRSQSRTTNADLENQLVQLSGYVLPLGNTPAVSQGQGGTQSVSEFLLVPYVGACIHVPPPPPNQMVYIKPPVPIENPGLFSAVEVTGKLRSQSGSYELFRVDGSQEVSVSYTLDLDAIAAAPNAASSSISGQLAGQQITGPWWQTLPARVSNVLTVSLGAISTQRSFKALALAMTLSFGYGVLHTLGPGHGKAVIISYFVGNGGSLQRGILMGIRIAVFHVLSAVVIVIFTDRLVQQVGGSSASSYRVVQLISYGAIALIGSWMLRQALRNRNKLHTAPEKTSEFVSQTVAPQTGAAKDNAMLAEAMLYPSLSQQLSLPEKSSSYTQNKNTASNNTQNNNTDWLACSCLACGDQQKAGGWLALAVGAVPCSGALIVLLYGLANDLLWPSVAMVISISMGMAFTLAWIGSLAILGNRYGHQAAARRRPPRSSGKPRKLSRFSLARFSFAKVAQIAGASCVALLGMSLFVWTLAIG